MIQAEISNMVMLRLRDSGLDPPFTDKGSKPPLTRWINVVSNHKQLLGLLEKLTLKILLPQAQIIHKCEGMFSFPMNNKASKLIFIQEY